jgi:predicted nucleotidyltransferase
MAPVPQRSKIGAGLRLTNVLKMSTIVLKRRTVVFKEIFGSKTRQIILKTFFNNPDEEFYTRQLASMNNVSVGTLHRELKKLISLGLLLPRKVGNIKLFSINKESPIYSELKNIFYKTEGIIKYVTSVVLDIKGIRVAFVYGSFAKGDERKDSDVDLFIIGDNIDDDKLIEKISDLEKELVREINYTTYSEAEYLKEKKNKDSFVQRVIRSEKIFLKGSADEL